MHFNMDGFEMKVGRHATYMKMHCKIHLTQIVPEKKAWPKKVLSLIITRQKWIGFGDASNLRIIMHYVIELLLWLKNKYMYIDTDLSDSYSTW